MSDYRFDPDWAPDEQRHLDEEYISWREDQADRERDERAIEPPRDRFEDRVREQLLRRQPNLPMGGTTVSRGAF